MTSAHRSWLKTAVRQPQQIWLRKAVFQVHLWCGLFLALYIIAISVSGSILVFKDELMPRPHDANIPFSAKACTPQHLLAAMDTAARANLAMNVSLVSCPTEANPFYAVGLHHRTSAAAGEQSLTVYVQPATGKIAGQVDQDATWLGTVERFHLDLFLKHNGRLWNGAAAALLMTIVLSGAVLWWPGLRNWRRAFRVDLRRTWKRINWDLHGAAGIWTLFFTLTWAVSGIYFAWQKPFEQAINAISPITTARYPQEEMDRLADRPASPARNGLSLQNVLKQASDISPDGAIEGLYFGVGPKAVLTIYMARAHLGDYTQTDFIYFDQQTGDHLYTWSRGRNATLGDWLLWLLVPLHFGTSWGLPGKVVWCALGLVLPLLTATGVLMYWNRWLRKAVARSVP